MRPNTLSPIMYVHILEFQDAMASLHLIMNIVGFRMGALKRAHNVGLGLSKGKEHKSDLKDYSFGGRGVEAIPCRYCNVEGFVCLGQSFHY